MPGASYGSATIAASIAPERSIASRFAVRFSSMSSGIRGADRRSAATSSGRRYGATVWMTPSWSGPSSGFLPCSATVFTRAASSSARRACATTSSPIGVTSTSPLPRSKISTPSSSSRFFTAAERLGWLTKQRSAARPKWRSVGDGDDVFELGEGHRSATWKSRR